MTLPTVTAITVTYRTGPRLHDCLHALNVDPDIAEIIVINNGNPPEEMAWLSDFAATRDKVRLIEAGKNLGFGKAANLGAAAALGETLLFINPDAVIRWGSIPAMFAARVGLPEPWIVGGRIFGVDGKEQRGGRRRMLTLSRAMGLSKWNLEKEPSPDAPVEMDAISGAFFLTDRKTFRRLGGFDEGYFLHVEDIDLCRRVTEAGGKVVYTAQAGVMHDGATSDAPSAVVEGHKADSLQYYFRKFARGPMDRMLNALILPIMGWAVRRRGR